MKITKRKTQKKKDTGLEERDDPHGVKRKSKREQRGYGSQKKKKKPTAKAGGERLDSWLAVKEE